MIIFLIIGLLLGALAVIFALQNVAAITVTFLVWQIHGSLALLLLVAVAVGVMISLLLSLPEVIKTHLYIAHLRKQYNKTKDELDELKTESQISHATVITTEQEKIISTKQEPQQ